MKNLWFILVSLSLISACGITKKAPGVKDIMSQRYNSIEATKNFSDDNSLLDIDALVSIQPKVDTTSTPPAKTVFSLAGEGQKALFDIFAQKDKEAQGRLTDLLNAQYQTPPEEMDEDYVYPCFSIVLSVNPKNFYQDITKEWSEADRIKSIDISISLSPESQKLVQFKSWDKAVTQYATYNAGGVSYTNSRVLTINPSVTIAGNSFSLGSYASTNGYTAGDSIKEPIVVMSGTLQPGKLSLQENGSPAISLFGNTSLSVTPLFKYIDADLCFAFTGLKNDDGVFQEPSKVKVKEFTIFYPQLENDIPVTISLDYEIRHVIAHSNTIEEGDDDIQYYTGHKERTLDAFIHAADLRPVTRTIENGSVRIGLWDEEIQTYHELNFGSYKTARQFLDWIIYTAPKTNNFIKIGRYKITASMDFATKIPVFLNSLSIHQLRMHTER